MDRAKHSADTLEAFCKNVLVSRRGFCAEAFSRESVERKSMRILVIVRCDILENRIRRKSKVSLAMYVIQGLVST